MGFRSAVLEAARAEISEKIGRPKLRRLFETGFLYTLETAVQTGELDGGPDTFVATGDIPAMWLRDSAAQMWPYLRWVQGDAALERLMAGVLRRQARCILLDPYANAFTYDAEGERHGEEYTDVKPGVWERKWELDSLCYPVRLAHGFWKSGADVRALDNTWAEAAKLIVRTMREQQRWEGPGTYRYEHPEVPCKGLGAETKPNGLVHSLYRPSDDVTTYPFLIPANLFAVTALGQLADLARGVWRDQALAADCQALAAEVEAAVWQQGVTDHAEYGRVLAYEIDGLGNAVLMDDANVPSLLGLAYLDPGLADNPVYAATRKMVLSAANPHFYRGEVLSGIGSSHTAPGTVWPMAIIVQALTSRDEDEIRQCLAWLEASDDDTGLIHESVDPNDPSMYTRADFAWPNALLAELIIRLAQDPERRQLLR